MWGGERKRTCLTESLSLSTSINNTVNIVAEGGKMRCFLQVKLQIYAQAETLEKTDAPARC